MSGSRLLKHRSRIIRHFHFAVTVFVFILVLGVCHGSDKPTVVQVVDVDDQPTLENGTGETTLGWPSTITGEFYREVIPRAGN